MTRWIITLFCLLAATAAGQDPGAAVPSDPDAPDLPVDAERLGQIYRERWHRRYIATKLNVVLEDIAVSEEDPRVVAGLGADGRVVITRNAGATWATVMTPLNAGALEQSSDEDDLMGVEARIDELMDAAESRDLDELGEEYEGYSEEQLLEEMSREADEALEEATLDVQTDLDADPGFVTDARVGGADVSKIWIFAGNVVFVSRSDGFWVSQDLGEKWVQALPNRVLSMSRLESGLWVCGTSDGARVAVEPNRWMDIDDSTEGHVFSTMQSLSNGVLAGGPDGLWFSADGQSWERKGGFLGAIQYLKVNPRAESEVWIVSEHGMVTTSDGGRTFLPSVPIAVPMNGIRSVMMLDVGRILLSGNEGIVETTDGGVTWRLFNRGMAHFQGARLFQWGPEGPHVLAGGQVYRLGPAQIGERALEDVSKWVPLEELVRGATNREGLEPPPSFRKRRLLASMVPTLRVEGWYRDDVDLGWNRYSGTVFDTRGEVSAMVRLFWVPRARSRTDVGLISSGNRTLMVMDGRDGAATIRLNQQLASYRAEVAERVIALYRARKELVLEREQMVDSSLLDQVIQDLLIRHVESDLDVLSGYVVSRWRTK